MLIALLLACYLLALAVLVGGGLVRRLRAAPAGEALAFAREHGVPTSAAGIELSRRYLSRARQFRFLCSVAGLLVGAVIGRWWIVSWVPGWFVGVIATEVFRLGRAAPTTGASRTASLAPRTTGTYRPRSLARYDRAVAVVAVGLAIGGCYLPWPADDGALVFLAVLVALACGLTELAAWAIAARRRPGLTGDLLEADDAIRRVGATAVAYAGAGLLTLLLFFVIWVAFPDHYVVVSPGATGRTIVNAPAPDSPLQVWMRVGGLGLLAWAGVLGATEHRFFWPVVGREPSEPTAWRRLGRWIAGRRRTVS